jgi:hypothetical protein
LQTAQARHIPYRGRERSPLACSESTRGVESNQPMRSHCFKPRTKLLRHTGDLGGVRPIRSRLKPSAQGDGGKRKP